MNKLAASLDPVTIEVSQCQQYRSLADFTAPKRGRPLHSVRRRDIFVGSSRPACISAVETLLKGLQKILRPQFEREKIRRHVTGVQCFPEREPEGRVNLYVAQLAWPVCFSL
jgi:hypothetical protein